MKSLITAAAIAAALPLAGCVTSPGTTVGKPEFTTLAGKPVAITDPQLAPVRKGCKARYQSVYGTELDLYGAYGADYTGAIDDMKNCFQRHGFKLAYRQPSGQLTPYVYHDSRLDY